MAVSVTLTKVIKEPAPSTRCIINFSDGTQMEFDSIASVIANISTLDSDPDVARKMLIGWWVGRDANLSNPNLVEGKTLTFDLQAPNLLRVQ